MRAMAARAGRRRPRRPCGALESAVDLAEPDGWVRVLVDADATHGPGHADACPSAGRGRRSSASCWRRARPRAALRALTTPAAPRLLDPLSDRELEVLRLLASDLDGPAIARRARGLTQHRQDPHQAHLHQARRQQPTLGSDPGPPAGADPVERRSAAGEAATRMRPADPDSVTPSVTSSGDAGSPSRLLGSSYPRGARRGATTDGIGHDHHTRHTSTRAAGLAAVAAGAIFIGVQIAIRSWTSPASSTTEWVVRSSLKVLMAALALVGITGMYLHQVTKMGVLGLVGYLLFAANYLLIFGSSFVAASVLPSIDATSPSFVKDVLAAASGGHASGDIGLLGTALLLDAGSVSRLAGCSSASRSTGLGSCRAGRPRSWPSAASRPRASR